MQPKTHSVLASEEPATTLLSFLTKAKPTQLCLSSSFRALALSLSSLRMSFTFTLKHSDAHDAALRRMHGIICESELAKSLQTCLPSLDWEDTGTGPCAPWHQLAPVLFASLRAHRHAVMTSTFGETRAKVEAFGQAMTALHAAKPLDLSHEWPGDTLRVAIEAAAKSIPWDL